MKELGYKDESIIGKPICQREILFQTDDKVIEKRELLQIELNKQGDKSVAIIMMNPSEADSNKSDGTVNKVIEFFLKVQRPLNEGSRKITDIKYLNVLNLLPIYNPKSKGLLDDLGIVSKEKSKEYLLSLLDSNIQINIETLRKSDYVVLAWGMPDNFPLTLYFELAAKVLKEISSIKEIYVFRVRNSKATYHLTKHLNPPHPSYCQLLGLVRVDVDKFYRIIPRDFEDENISQS
ncbi:DUF1643 domain-containing protein [Paenibacillus sp. CC-CFT747]|nr:DUF1643 domain-containing protein [Paenibacillus sp. CC-CFT747]